MNPINLVMIFLWLCNTSWLNLKWSNFSCDFRSLSAFSPFFFLCFYFFIWRREKKLGLLQRKRWVLRITGELDYDEEMMRLSTISIYRSVLLGYFQSATNWKADPLAKILNRNHYKRLPFNNDSLIKSLLKPTF
jgi:hypothetical protein